MQKNLITIGIATLVSFVANHFFLPSTLGEEAYSALVLGGAWLMAYLLDRPYISLPKKLGLSFLPMLILVVAANFLFSEEVAFLTFFTYSAVFVLYYVVASFRSGKSLRN